MHGCLSRGSPTRRGATLLFALLLGCSGGLIGDPSAGSGNGAPGTDGPIGPGGPGGAGDGSGDGTDGGDMKVDPEDLQIDGGDPGRVTVRRLNRTEYANTVHDLMGVHSETALEFPSDDVGYGFDNIADVLTMSPLLAEMYLNAAEEVVGKVLYQSVTDPQVQHVEAETVGSDVGAASGEVWNLYSNGTVANQFTLPADGDYEFRVRVYCQQGGPDDCQMSLDVDGLPETTVNVTETSSAPGLYSVMVTLTEGPHMLGASFLNDYYDPDMGIDRNLLLDWLEVEGPLGVAPGPNPLTANIVSCDPGAIGNSACAREVLTQITPRAWRRPVDDSDIDPLMALYQIGEDEEGTFEAGLSLALQGVLVSPHFLFRVELDPDPLSPDVHLLSAHELATRLSYFLWSTMPDDKLRAAADDGSLLEPDVLEDQARRMLRHEKAGALVDNFASQWLFLREFDEHEAEYSLFPQFDETLQGAMRRETELMFARTLDGTLGMDALLTSDYTFANDRLAQFYGLGGGGADFEMTSLGGTERRGLLGQAAIQTLTSYPARTSPVKRGKFILEQLLCSPPAPPPPGVEGLIEEEMPSGTLRERMEQHRKDPLCASCHTVMDPLGFALENFDAIGAYRTKDSAGFPIDASGELTDGTMIDGVADLADALKEDPRYSRCVAEKLFIYAVGRGPTADDAAYLDLFATRLEGAGFSLPDLIVAIVTSDPFRMRRGEKEGEAP